MPGTQYSEAALERRNEKVAFALAFPGRLQDWDEAVGRTVQAIVGAGETRAAVFEDACFLPLNPPPIRSDDLLQTILAARPLIEDRRAGEFAELDLRIEREREAMRLARMEKVLGAVATNLPQVPELRPALLELLGSEPDGHL